MILRSLPPHCWDPRLPRLAFYLGAEDLNELRSSSACSLLTVPSEPSSQPQWGQFLTDGSSVSTAVKGRVSEQQGIRTEIWFRSEWRWGAIQVSLRVWCQSVTRGLCLCEAGESVTVERPAGGLSCYSHQGERNDRARHLVLPAAGVAREAGGPVGLEPVLTSLSL